MLYDFKTKYVYRTELTLSEFLDAENYPKITVSGLVIVRADLTREEALRNILYKDDGIYLNINGVEYRGYIYLKYTQLFQGEFKKPKFHITKCKTIDDAITRGDFSNRYFWHNSNIVDVQSKPGNRLHTGLNLEICGNCRRHSTTSTTQSFFDSLENHQRAKTRNETVIPDLFGYTTDWENIGQNFKKRKLFTCERCSIKMTGIDRRYIHADHKDGNKLNNLDINLGCLCILCHCYKDAHHRENFGKKRMKRELQSYVEKFRSELAIKGNPFLAEYDIDNL